MPSKDRHRSSRESQKRVQKPLKRRPVSESSDRSSQSSSSSSSSSSSNEHSGRRQRSPSPAKEEFAQIYTKDDYQKLLRDYKALYEAHEVSREASESLRQELSELQVLEQEYTVERAEEMQQEQIQQEKLEEHINKLLTERFAELQGDVQANEMRNSSLSSSNQELVDELRKLRETQNLTISDLRGEFNEREGALKAALVEVRQLRAMLTAYFVLTGVQFSLTSNFEKPKISEAQKLQFCLGDPEDPESFHARLAFNGSKAAIECIKAPSGPTGDVFKTGIACQTDELWVVFGQMCAKIAELKIDE